MTVKIHSIESAKAARRKLTVETQVPFSLNGERHTVTKKIVNGEMDVLECSKPIGEMLTFANSRKELLEKVVLDVELGREMVPVLYGPIYERLEDRNFPKTFEAKWAQWGTVVFLEHLEGEEVKFGSMMAENGPIAHINGYAAGFEYTKEMQIFNQTFNFEILNRAFGEAHNALLNHLHFGPILAHNYLPANQTAPVLVDYMGNITAVPADVHRILSIRATIKQAIVDARTAGRPGTILIANSADQYDIEEAIGAHYIAATPFKPLEGISDIIYYDGWQTQVSQKTYAYPGVTQGHMYLVRPRRGFKELVKQQLEVNAHIADPSRLIEAQIIGDFWRGVFAAIDENVQEITLP